MSDSFWLGERYHSHQCSNCGVIYDCWLSWCKRRFQVFRCDVCNGIRPQETGGV